MADFSDLLCKELDLLAGSVRAITASDEPLNIAHGNWSFTSASIGDLSHEAASIAELIRDNGLDENSENAALLRDYPRRLAFMRANLVPQIWGGNSAQAVSTYLGSLQILREALKGGIKTDKQTDASSKLKRLTIQLRGMEARLQELEPRSANLSQMVGRIEQAYEAADLLPSDLAEMQESRSSMGKLLEQADKENVNIALLRGQAETTISAAKESLEELLASLKARDSEAEKVMLRCESAYSASTSQGLAAAFYARSRELNWSMWIWVVGLVSALLFGGTYGTKNLQELSALVRATEVAWPSVAVNLVIGVLSVGASVWFAWLATKQIGQRFRLSEDYAFKASISKAYEGYRREAARFDTGMQERLLSSALARLDELPLRLVETESHGSPWQEAIASQTMKDAIKSVPGFAGRVLDLAKEGLGSLRTSPAKSASSVGTTTD